MQFRQELPPSGWTLELYSSLPHSALTLPQSSTRAPLNLPQQDTKYSLGYGRAARLTVLRPRLSKPYDEFPTLAAFCRHGRHGGLSSLQYTLPLAIEACGDHEALAE